MRITIILLVLIYTYLKGTSRHYDESLPREVSFLYCHTYKQVFNDCRSYHIFPCDNTSFTQKTYILHGQGALSRVTD